jgi:hypothetical protein
MTDTPNLGLPFIEAAQAQKHVPHNEALRVLDTLVQLSVAASGLTSPPPTPAEGQRWIVAASATGAWSGHDNAVAVWPDAAWVFLAPASGWIAYDTGASRLLVFTGSAWDDAAAHLSTLQNMTLLGVGTTADTTNPFSAKLNNALWTARTAGEGGDGDLRYKMNKETTGDTVSLLMQTNFSGRAEIGLTGDDDLRVKVSSDGATWTDSLIFSAATGNISTSHDISATAITASGPLKTTNTTASSSTTSGALTVAGGIGVAGQLSGVNAFFKRPSSGLNTDVVYVQKPDSTALGLGGNNDTYIRFGTSSAGRFSFGAYNSGSGDQRIIFEAVNNFDLDFQHAGASLLRLKAGGGAGFSGPAGFNGSSPLTKPTVSGSRAGNAALASLLTALANYGLITDSTTS